MKKKSSEGFENPKEDLRVQRTKHILRESIAKLLEKKDLNDISIQQISKKAMIYRTTFYSHYTTKYELLEDYLMESWKNELDFKTNVDSKNIYKIYWDGILQTANFFKRYSNLFIQLNESISIISKSNLLYATLKEFFMIWLNLLQSDDSKLRMPREKICDFYISGYLKVIFEWLLSGAKETSEEMREFFIALTDKNLNFLLNLD